MLKQPITNIDKNNIIKLSRIVITVGLLAYLIIYVDVDKILNRLYTADYFIISVVAGLSFINLFLQFTKWRIVSSHQLNITDKRMVLHSLFYGISAGIFTPLKLGEFVARSIPFKDKSVVEVSIATLIDKSIPLLIILTVGIICAVNYLLIMDLVSALQVSYIAVVIIALVIISIMLKKFSRNLKKKLTGIKVVEKFINQLKVVRLVKGEYLLKLIIASALFHLVFTSQMALLIMAFSGQPDFLQFLYIANLVIFVQIIIPPIAFGELGIREGAAVYFVTAFGLNASVGFNSAFFIFIINFLLPSIYGLFFIARKKI